MFSRVEEIRQKRNPLSFGDEEGARGVGDN